jgi:GNAT superfamily N-acetyltransferase
MKIIHVDHNDCSDVCLLQTFINTVKGQQPHFRYFNKRGIECTQNHLVTLVGVGEEGFPLAYGHLDTCQGKIWLGISVLNQFHGKGYGGQIMRELITFFETNCASIPSLSLTVDKDNTIAIDLYKKYGFGITNDATSYYEMTLMHKKMAGQESQVFTLQVSCGEALDKLSILEIKMDKINDQRVIDVKKEYDTLAPILKPVISAYHCEFLYNLLKTVNLKIWNDQDLFRDGDKIDKGRLCTEIIGDNDKRFRIKNKLNARLNSSLKEQKGYKITKALVISHLLMGDQILMVPAVRYLSMIYDEVHVWSIKKFIEQIRLFYVDDPCIKVIECSDNWWRDPQFYLTNGLDGIGVNAYQKNDIYAGGIHVEYVKGVTNVCCDRVPYCFYGHMGLPHHIYWDYFHINQTITSHELLNMLGHDKSCGQESIPYVFIHAEIGAGPLFTISEVEARLGQSHDDILFVDPNVNRYPPGHHFYEIARKLVGHKINDYIQLMIHANYIYVSDSCFFCLAMQLGLKTPHCYVKTRNPHTNYDYMWSKEYGFDDKIPGFGSSHTRKRFTQF